LGVKCTVTDMGGTRFSGLRGSKMFPFFLPSFKALPLAEVPRFARISWVVLVEAESPDHWTPWPAPPLVTEDERKLCASARTLRSMHANRQLHWQRSDDFCETCDVALTPRRHEKCLLCPKLVQWSFVRETRAGSVT
jgi:hypothetical protein